MGWLDPLDPAGSQTERHRRVLHLEFAASPDLPDGYAWHDFRPGWRPSSFLTG